jgi:hypothetical protein
MHPTPRALRRLAAAASLAAPFLASGQPSVPFSVEAESVSFSSTYWSKVNDSGASAGQGFRALLSSTSAAPSGGGLLYPFSLSSPATIYLHIKAKAANTSSDSVWVRLNGGSWVAFTLDASNSFAWRHRSFSSVAAGNHTFEIRVREANALLDVVGVTLDTTPPFHLSPSLPPSGNFDLGRWKYTKPDGTEVQVSSVKNGYTLNNRFYTDPATGGMVFRCGNSEGTTSGSTYTRSELREMLSGTASTSATSPVNNWYLSGASSIPGNAGGIDGTMKATLTVDRVSTTGDSSKVGRVIVGQIHASTDEPCRLYYHKRPGDSKGAVYFAHEYNGATTWHDLIGGRSSLNPSDGIALGEIWSYEIKQVGRNLTVTIRRPGKTDVARSITIHSGFLGRYMYFKAGVYNQNNTGETDPTKDFVKATFYELTATHP